jgi:methionine synthase I (cobalamin-dependent)
MKLTEYLKENRIYLDGGTGTMLQEAGLAVGELPERWNISHPEVLRSLHKAYYDAGSNIVSANTFGANILKFSEDELEEIVREAIAHVKQAAKESQAKQEKWVAADLEVEELIRNPGEPDFDAVQTQIGITADDFALDMLVLKFIQGLPVVGVVGGLSNPVYFNKIMEYVRLKYHKRYLLNKKEEME